MLDNRSSRQHIRLSVVQYEIHSLLSVKLDVSGQILVPGSINAHREAWLPLLPSIKHSRLLDTRPPLRHNNRLHVQVWHACRFFASFPVLLFCAAWPGLSYRPEAGLLKHTRQSNGCQSTTWFHLYLTDEEEETITSPVPQHQILVIRQPAEARELQIVSTWGLDCDVPAVPVVLHPVLSLLDLHQHDLTQVLLHVHIVGVHLQCRRTPIKSVVMETFSSTKEN